MKLKILILFLMLAIPAFAQNDDQSIELPDFVITGIQSAALPEINKGLPKLVSVLSKIYLNPVYSTDELSSYSFSEPPDKNFSLFRKVPNTDMRLKIGSGFYTIPAGYLLYTKDINSIIFRIKAGGEMTRSYVAFAGSNYQKLEAGMDYLVSHSSTFLPGSKLSLNTNFTRDHFKFFAASSPDYARNIYSGNAELKFIDTYPDNFNFGISAKDHMTYLQENDINENVINAGGFADIFMDFISLHFRGNYLMQNASNFQSSNVGTDYLWGSAEISLKSINAFQLKFGAYYSQLKSDKFLSPTAKLLFEIDNNLVIMGEFTPATKFLSLKDLVTENKYYSLNNLSFVERVDKSNLGVGIKYEYRKYFVIAGGFKHSTSDNFPYFQDDQAPGFFDLHLLDDVRQTSFYINLLFHPGPFGVFYAEAKYRDTRTDAGLAVPYYPFILASGSYSFNFDFGLFAKISADYLKNIYTDINNSNKIDSYFNLMLELEYKINDKLNIFADFENLLDKRNFLIKRYRQKPFDIITGIYYRW